MEEFGGGGQGGSVWVWTREGGAGWLALGEGKGREMKVGCC